MLIEGAHHGGAAWSCQSGNSIDADVLDAWFDPCPGVVSVLQDRAGWLARTSPPADGSMAIESIAKARDLDPERIVLGAGSSDLIYRAMLRLVSPQDQVLVLDPGYSEYPHLLGNVIGCEVRTHRLEPSSSFVIDLERLRRDADGCRWAILANPNNPAGSYVAKPDILEFVDSLGPETFVWLDEAYLEYVEGAKSLELEVSRRNLIVLRSLSKTLALSGLRAGYLVAPQQVAVDLRRVTPPWIISLPAQLAVRAALADPGYYTERYRQTTNLRSSLARRISEITGLEVIEGAANWVLILLPPWMPSAAEICASCAEQGLFIRNASITSKAFGDRAIRIAVKDGATNAKIVETLQTAMGQAYFGLTGP